MTKKINELAELTVTEDGDLLLIRDATDGLDKKIQSQNLRAKATTKDDVGLGSVPNLDTTDAVNKAHDQNTDIALDQGGANEVTAADARAHIDSTANPHGVTKAQVGLSDVDNVSAADLRDRSTHTGTQTLSTISDAGTIASQDANNVAITGGAIDGTSVGGTVAAAGTFTNFEASGTADFSSTGAVKIPVGTEAQRPTPQAGMLRFNDDVDEFEGYNGTAWASVGGSAISNDTATDASLYPVFVDSTTGTAANVFTSNAKLLYNPSAGELTSNVMVSQNGLVVNSATVTENYDIPAGSNAMSTGPLEIDDGVVVTIPTGSRWIVI